ncbi:MAG: molybdopterin-dependent oxidoreductase, partial [Planctomycetota bacterium]
ELDPEATLVLGPIPTSGEDEVFKHYITGDETFRIRAEKVPNKRGIERVLKLLGGKTAQWDELASMDVKGAWVTGNYLDKWVTTDAMPASLKDAFVVTTETIPNAIVEAADVVIPAATWAEKDGTWENIDNRIQPFEPAIEPLPGTHVEGEVFAKLLRRDGYDAHAIRQELSEKDDAFAGIELTAETETASETFEFAEL